jgi:capsular polysaccharide biosynthesis protein
MTNEISLEYLWKLFKAVWWKMLIFAVVIAIAAAAITMIIPKEYSSSTSFYIINASLTTEYTTSSLLSAAEYLSNDYIDIILGDKMISSILEMLKNREYDNIDTKELKAKDIREMISSSTSSKSSIFSVSVTCKNESMAHDICNYIEENAPAIIKEISRPATDSNIYVKDGNDYVLYDSNKLECVEVVREATKAVKVSPNLPMNTAISAVLAAILTYAYFFVRKLFDTTIRTANDITTLVDKPIIAEIPDWELGASAQKSRQY